MDERRIVIRHPDGREYAVLPSLYHEQYEPQGFAAIVYQDGTPYTPPKRKPAPKAAETGTDEG